MYSFVLQLSGVNRQCLDWWTQAVLSHITSVVRNKNPQSNALIIMDHTLSVNRSACMWSQTVKS